MRNETEASRIPDDQTVGLSLYPEAISQVFEYLRIETIEDIKPYIRPNDGIFFFEEGDFIICRYTSALPTTFQTKYDIECRCMIFCRASGVLLSRTFHKFFNLGERQSLLDIDLSQGARLENKLDGSMIGAFVWNDRVHYHTRGGFSDQAKAAAQHALPGHNALVKEAFAAGFTAIFEFTGPDNRVVIPYDAKEMTLLALRHRTTGAYDKTLRNALAKRHGIRIPDDLEAGITTVQGMLDALSKLRRRKDIEGAVLVLPCGHRLKAKTDDYMRRHKILGNIDKEKYVFLCYLEDVLDDTSAALGGERGRVLIDYIADMDRRINSICEDLRVKAGPLSSLPAKHRAEKIKQTWTGILQAGAFVAVAGLDPKSRILEVMARQVRNEEKRDTIKRDLGLPSWTVDIHALR